jgi:hypothetical protein
MSEEPQCTGRKGYEGDFDCDSFHHQSCEDCLCNFVLLGGLWNPDTGKKVSKQTAYKIYGGKEKVKAIRKASNE